MFFSALHVGQGIRVRSAQTDLEVPAAVFQVASGGRDCRGNRMRRRRCRITWGHHSVIIKTCNTSDFS